MDLSEHPHRRYNILTGEWILVSPHRMKRPWQGKTEKPPREDQQKYNPKCYLCPGNERAGGIKNPKYKSTFVFDNDFGALLPHTPVSGINQRNLLIAKGEPGICRVICFSPRHDLTLAEMKISDIKQVVNVWTQEFKTLGKKPEINYVQIFENKGEIMGCSNPHPHGQIWASHTIPGEPQKEQIRQLQFYENKKNVFYANIWI